jgi:uncharacterized protein YdaL
VATRRLLAIATLVLSLGLGGQAFALGDAGGYDVDDNGELDVLILYDNSGPWAELGPIFAEMLMNLMGHFTAVEAWAIPLEEYAAGDLSTNEVTFYIGSTYDAPMPQAFLDDFWTNDRPLIWMGYNLWQVAWPNWNEFLFDYGFTHWYIAGNSGEGEGTDSFRYVQYKGKELQKFAWWNTDAQAFINDPFTSIFYVYDAAMMDVHAEIVHSGTGEVVPYVFTSGNLTVYSDLPMTFLHDRDRYLVLADLMHDHLGIDHEESRTALMRLEDVHPNVSYTDIRTITNVMKEGHQRPWTVVVTPYYTDPLGYYHNGVPTEFSMNETEARRWRRQIERAQRNGATVLMHGYTHQYASRPNPFNGVTGDDWEFWLMPEATPVPEDSYAWFGDRMDAGLALFDARGWEPWAFEMPHYQGSPGSYLWLQDWHDTSYHRTVYYPYEVDLWGDVYTMNEIWGDSQSVQDWSAASIALAGDQWGGQFFPYLIEHDVYGQKVIPENLGSIEPAEFALAPEQIQLVPDMLEVADLNLVNRCAYASFFFHPYLVQFPELADAGGPDALRDIIDGLEAMGYTFEDASQL